MKCSRIEFVSYLISYLIQLDIQLVFVLSLFQPDLFVSSLHVLIAFSSCLTAWTCALAATALMILTHSAYMAQENKARSGHLAAHSTSTFPAQKRKKGKKEKRKKGKKEKKRKKKEKKEKKEKREKRGEKKKRKKKEKKKEKKKKEEEKKTEAQGEGPFRRPKGEP